MICGMWRKLPAGILNSLLILRGGALLILWVAFSGTRHPQVDTLLQPRNPFLPQVKNLWRSSKGPEPPATTPYTPSTRSRAPCGHPFHTLDDVRLCAARAQCPPIERVPFSLIFCSVMSRSTPYPVLRQHVSLSR